MGQLFTPKISGTKIFVPNVREIFPEFEGAPKQDQFSRPIHGNPMS